MAKTIRNILVLGAGRVGQAIARDLSHSFSVTTADINPENLKPLEGITGTFTGDLDDPSLLSELVGHADLVVGALPGDLGFRSLKNIIPLRKPVVDISFFPEDPEPLDRLAKEHGTTLIYDCGVAPGMGNIIFGYHDRGMDIDDYICYVGGLPFERKWPWEYKAVFSPLDVIEEYTRPARYRVNGSLVTREALSDPELIEFDGIGTLEAWNSDGLRSLLNTMRAPNMIEKTLRYPGTIRYLKALRDSGFFSKKAIDIGGNMIRPLDLTARLLQNEWAMLAGDREFTVMRIIIRGTEDGITSAYQYDLYDKTDDASGISSMARTTGYTATAVVSLLATGADVSPGCNPPEVIGRLPGALDYILKYQEERGISYIKSEFTDGT